MFIVVSSYETQKQADSLSLMGHVTDESHRSINATQNKQAESLGLGLPRSDQLRGYTRQLHKYSFPSLRRHQDRPYDAPLKVHLLGTTLNRGLIHIWFASEYFWHEDGVGWVKIKYNAPFYGNKETLFNNVILYSLRGWTSMLSLYKNSSSYIKEKNKELENAQLAPLVVARVCCKPGVSVL